MRRRRSLRRRLDETASFVLDDMEFAPGQVESPSQISQGTVSVASEMEDTLAGVQTPRKPPGAAGAATGCGCAGIGTR